MPRIPRQRVVACVIRRDDRYLVCQRPATKRHAGMWEFPGGKIEADESDEQAAARELKEELGVELIRAGAVLYEIADCGSSYLIAFVPVDIRGEPRCLEHSRMKWATRAELLDLPLAPSDRTFLEFLERREMPPTDALLPG